MGQIQGGVAQELHESLQGGDEEGEPSVHKAGHQVAVYLHVARIRGVLVCVQCVYLCMYIAYVYVCACVRMCAYVCMVCVCVRAS